jgi:hypothetical protein
MILDGLPEEASLEDIRYHLYVLQRIQRGREDVAQGRALDEPTFCKSWSPAATV